MLARALVLSLIVVVAAGCRPPAPRPASTASRVPDAVPACQRALAPLANDGDLATAIAALQKRAAGGAIAGVALEQLGFALVSHARLTHDDGVYAQALDVAACLEARDAGNHQARVLRGHVLHQQHRFAEAEAIARTLVAARGSVLDHGLLGDLLVERGALDEAAVHYQRMIDLKPYYQSYTRAGHLRWLKGNLDGAVEMLRLAVAAASPRDPEAGPWARSRLAFLELQAGRFAAARAECQRVLTARADYAPALVVLGRVALAERRPAEAAEVLARAVAAQPLPEAEWLLADALRAAGREADAVDRERDLARAGRERDPRTTALWLATRGQSPDEALRLAEAEIGRRADVHTTDALAWALATSGRVTEARPHAERALAAGTEDPRLFLHAGIIALASGDRAAGERWLRGARRLEHLLLPSERAWLAEAPARARRLARGA